MTGGPGGDSGPEPTFADVMNAFSLDSGRKKRRRWGRRDEDDPAALPDAGRAEPAEPQGWPGVAGRAVTEPGSRPELDPLEDTLAGSTSVRPYAWTRGRTRSGYALEIETLVSTSPRGRQQSALLQVEHREVAEMCRQVRSVAEVAALLKLPIGVAKVVVGDMAGLGLVTVHESARTNGDVPDFALMERVLSGLRRL